MAVRWSPNGRPGAFPVEEWQVIFKVMIVNVGCYLYHMMLYLFILNLNSRKNIPHTTASINGTRENQEDLDVAM